MQASTKIGFHFWVGLILIIFPVTLSAGELRGNFGASFTSAGVPLAGYSADLGYRSEGLDLWLVDFDGAETNLVYHSLSNLEASASNPALSFKAYEINYFLLKDLGGLMVGPGFGYGVAETSNTPAAGQTTSSSTFFTAKDIHYGVLAVKASKTWGNIGCDFLVSSFGGLIGGSLLCGLSL